MKMFTIWKKFAQVSGIFPFQGKKIFHISKLYLIMNVFLGFCLVFITGHIVKMTFLIADSDKYMQNREYPLYTTVEKLGLIIIYGRLSAALTTVITKVMWRREFIENLNAAFDFFRKDGFNFILNTQVISDYSFIASLSVSLIIEIGSIVVDTIFYYKLYLTYNLTLKYLIIIDEIMFSIVCSVLSKCQCYIKEMISNLLIEEETENVTTNDINLVQIQANDFFRIPLQQVRGVEKPIDRNYGRNVSTRAIKLENFRQMNLKLFNIHSNYSALHQYQLLFSIAVSTIEITQVMFIFFTDLTQNMKLESTSIIIQFLRGLGIVVTNLVRMFMVCYYNDKAFNEGVAIKYVVQEIRRISSDKNLLKVSKIFTDQVHARKQFKICGLFALDMTLPTTFIGYAVNYSVVLVQYLGLKL